MSFKTNLITHLPQWARDCEEIVRAFNPYLIIDKQSKTLLEITCTGQQIKIVSSFAPDFLQDFNIGTADALQYKRHYKRYAKNAIYKYISDFLGISLAYGSATGVRPTTLVRKIPQGNDRVDYLVSNYFIERKRAQLLTKVVDCQKGYISYDSNEIDIYINIPFCPTRCTYCSFISTEVHRVASRLASYVDAIRYEAKRAIQHIVDTNKKIRAIYIGGGTPTCLPCYLLERLLQPFAGKCKELCVEAGRPDTLNYDKLQLFSQYGVTRISINPQSLNDSTLQRIGRAHSVADFYRAYELASSFDFIKNTDIILGLPGESGQDIASTIQGILALQPENVTLHTLSLKKGGYLKKSTTKADFAPIKEYADRVLETFDKSGYLPYYIYRQKNMLDGLENIGYMLADMPCLYNIDNMEETHSILGLGAGAMTKSVDGKLIARHKSPKDINYYFERLEDNLEKKLNLLQGRQQDE